MITRKQLQDVIDRINADLLERKIYFAFSLHFREDRINHPRNIPPIEITEIETIFNRVIEKYLEVLIELADGDSFCIKCTESFINMPCSVEFIKARDGKNLRKNIIITIMRKKDFISKDSLILTV